jgi:hypothetical protein
MPVERRSPYSIDDFLRLRRNDTPLTRAMEAAEADMVLRQMRVNREQEAARTRLHEAVNRLAGLQATVELLRSTPPPPGHGALRRLLQLQGELLQEATRREEL